METFAEYWNRKGYEDGFKEGYDEGYKKGLKNGHEEVRLRRRRVLLTMLTKRLGFVTEETKKRVEGATSEMLDEWTINAMDADGPDEVLCHSR